MGVRWGRPFGCQCDRKRDQVTHDKRQAAVQMIAQANGKLYDANFDHRITQAVTECKDLCYDYNQLRPSAHEERKELLRTIVGSMGQSANIVSPF